MANKRKEGLTHFPLDVDIFDDEKLFIAEDYVDPNGYDTPLRILMDKVLIRLYCIIYKNGYAIKWDHKMIVTITRLIGNGINNTLLEKIMKALLKAELFDNNMFETNQILTSKRIQETWIDVVYRARRVHQTLHPDYKLLSDKEIKLIRAGKKASATEIEKNVAESSKSATEIKKQGPHAQHKTLSKPSSGEKNVAESSKSATKSGQNDKLNHRNTGKNVDNLSLKGKNVAVNGISATENEKNVAESEKPFTLSSSNNISNSIVTTTEREENAENVAESENNVAESEKSVTEIEDADVVMIIDPADESEYPVENCLFNLTHPNYSRTFEQICSSYYMDPERLKKFAEALNRMLIRNGTYLKPMSGSKGYLKHLSNWIATQDDWEHVDPDTLYKLARSKKANANSSSKIPGANATEEEVKTFYKPRVYE